MRIVEHRHSLLVVSALLALVLNANALPALAQPSEETPTGEESGEELNPLEQLDEATREVVELENRISEIEAETIAIRTRLDVLHVRIDAQRDELELARQELKAARAVYGDRVVTMYKHGTTNPLLMLLRASSFEDLVATSSLLSRIVAQDRSVWERTASAAADEHFQTQVLEDLLAQERELRDINEVRRTTLERHLERQEALVGQLTEEAEAYLAELRAQSAQTRQDWIDSSIPGGTEIDFVPAVVEPYLDRTYLVPVHQPTRYRSISDEQIMVCSWYGNEFNGRPTASGQIFNEDDFTCASRTLPFGTRLALTRGDRRIVVVVTDRGPFIAGRDLDLAKAAAFALGFSGVEPVHAEFVEALPELSE